MVRELLGTTTGNFLIDCSHRDAADCDCVGFRWHNLARCQKHVDCEEYATDDVGGVLMCHDCAVNGEEYDRVATVEVPCVPMAELVGGGL